MQRYCFKHALETGVVHGSVHDNCFKHGPFPNHKFYDSVNQDQNAPAMGLDYSDKGGAEESTPGDSVAPYKAVMGYRFIYIYIYSDNVFFIVFRAEMMKLKVYLYLKSCSSNLF